jgi:hypothetical protein
MRQSRVDVVYLPGDLLTRSTYRLRRYFSQAGWPQSQAISASFAPASLQNWLQYFSPAGAMHRQGKCAHFLDPSVAMFRDSFVSSSAESTAAIFEATRFQLVSTGCIYLVSTVYTYKDASLTASVR